MHVPVCLDVESLDQQFYIFKQQEDKTKKNPQKNSPQK